MITCYRVTISEIPLQTHPTPPTTRKNLLPRNYHDQNRANDTKNPPKNPPKNHPRTHPKPPIAHAGGSAPRSMRRVPVGLFPPPLPRPSCGRASLVGVLPPSSAARRGASPVSAGRGLAPSPPFGSGALASGSALCARVPRRVRALPRARPRSPRSPSAFGRG